LEVHRGHGTEHAAREVEILAAQDSPYKRDCLSIHVYDHTKGIEQKQPPGLRGNIAGRIAELEERLQVRLPSLRYDLAVTEWVKLVYHDPVIPGEALDILGSNLSAGIYGIYLIDR
jgi:hypothetical protein